MGFNVIVNFIIRKPLEMSKEKREETKTAFLTKKEGLASQGWILMNAEGKILGRLASEIAKILRGKHKTTFTPHIDSGDGVVIINAKNIKVTGNKEAQKIYHRYTGHIGGGRKTSYRTMMEKKPCEILRLAVKGMMPKTKLGRAQLKRLRIFEGNEHHMEAQKPISVDI